jgi:DNA-binding response OmpR family regulator
MSSAVATPVLPASRLPDISRVTDVPNAASTAGSGGETAAATQLAPTSPGGHVLVVDDEPAITEALAYNLRRHGYVPLIASDADAALRILRERSPAVVILDVMLPSGSGFEVCRLIRQSGNQVPILMLTARVSEPDRVRGLEVGADDYVIKPFGMRELIARVRALQRRSVVSALAGAASASSDEPRSKPVITVTALGLVIYPERREASLREKPLSLSRKEFDVLALLTAHPGRVFDRQTLLDRVWGQDAYVDDRTVDVHIRWLREKVEPTPGKPQFLLTVRGVGYKFQNG